jgi:pumilio RNA-binding family
MVFSEIITHYHKLMIDVFGNYVVQKILEHGTKEHRDALIKEIKGKVLTLSLQMYGCRVIQKALEVTSGEIQQSLIEEIKDNVMKCVDD